MTQQAIKYGRVLYELSVRPDEISSLEKMLDETPALYQILKSPAVECRQKKEALEVIAQRSGMSRTVLDFLKVLCDLEDAARLPEILRAYRIEADRAEKILRVQLYYAEAPSPAQMERLSQVLCRQFGAVRAEFEMTQEKKLLGGFVLRCAGREYDWSLLGRFKQLRQTLTADRALENAAG